MAKASTNFGILDGQCKDAVAALFTSSFASSEGAQEGALVGRLATALAARIDNRDIVGIGAYEDQALIGALFLTRLHFDPPTEAFMLSPVAVATAKQGRGMGQAMIRFGLDALSRRRVAFVVTYGDPAFYGKLGFVALSESVVPPPHPLSMPHGWLGQSLSENPIPVLQTRPACAPEFNDPAYW